MQRHDIAFLVDYNYWANTRVLAAAARLPPDTFVAPTTIMPRTIRSTLVHQLDVEWSWRLRWQGRSEAEPLANEDFATVDQLAVRWQVEEQAMRAYLATLTDADLEQPLVVGGGAARPLWQYIVHVINHGTQQRSDAAVLLTAAGYSPGGLDIADFVRMQHH